MNSEQTAEARRLADALLERGPVKPTWDAIEEAAALLRTIADAATAPQEPVDIVFDGPPGHVSGRFVEVENAQGQSILFGEWVHRADGYWVLRIKAAPPAQPNPMPLPPTTGSPTTAYCAAPATQHNIAAMRSKVERGETLPRNELRWLLDVAERNNGADEAGPAAALPAP